MNGGARGEGEERKMYSYIEEKDSRYYLFEKGKTTGPYSLSHLKAMVETGSARKTVPCKTGDEMEWHDLGYILKLKKMAPKSVPKNIAPLYEDPDDFFLSNFSKGEEPEAPIFTSGKPDGSMQHLIAGLIEVNANQNSLLQGIKWGLWSLILLILLGSAGTAVFLIN